MSFDVAIIGAGMAGASLAWSLAQRAPGLRVVLIEMEAQPGYHTTGRSAAFWVESYGGPGVVPLTRASRAFFLSPPPGFAERPLLSPRLALYLAPPDDADFDGGALAAVAAEFDEGAVGYRWCDVADTLAFPGLAMMRPEWRQRAIEEPDCYDIDVAALHQGYLRGCTVMTDAGVTGLVREGTHWRIATRAGEVQTGIVVNAAGAWADGLAAMAGARARGLQPLRRTMAVLDIEPAPPADLPVVMDAAGRFYFKPDSGRIWLSPHDETPDVAHDVRPDEMDLAVVIDRFERATQVRVKRLETSWAGLRTFAPDRLPVFGWDGDVDGFFWCAGQGGFGIQTAPAASDLCAALLLGEEPGVAAEAYLATREALLSVPI